MKLHLLSPSRVVPIFERFKIRRQISVYKAVALCKTVIKSFKCIHFILTIFRILGMCFVLQLSHWAKEHNTKEPSFITFHGIICRLTLDCVTSFSCIRYVTKQVMHELQSKMLSSFLETMAKGWEKLMCYSRKWCRDSLKQWRKVCRSSYVTVKSVAVIL